VLGDVLGGKSPRFKGIVKYQELESVITPMEKGEEWLSGKEKKESPEGKTEDQGKRKKIHRQRRNYDSKEEERT